MLDPSEPLPTTFWEGVEQFNQQEFYSCHNTLEALWIEASEPLRTFYQGILQIAVGCYHLSQGNQMGAMILLGEGSHRLRNYPDRVDGLEVATLRQQSQDLLAQLHRQMSTATQLYHFPQIMLASH